MSVKQFLKRSSVRGFVTLLGDIYAVPNMPLIFNSIKKYEKNKAILIGTPTHYNLGDHLIANNERMFLSEECGYTKIVEIPTRIFDHYKEMISDIINHHLPVFITGGGWMGDLWPEDQYVIEEIIDKCSNNSIYILPQTIFYSSISSNEFQFEIERTVNVFSKARKLTVFCRDEDSFDNARRFFNFSNITVSLQPDMGIYMKTIDVVKKEDIIAFCLRDDREKLLPDDIISIIQKYANSVNIGIKRISTIYIKPVPVWRRSKILNQRKKEFSKPQLIITDRLHGMIFSVISGTKCIAFDNKTHKVKGVYEKWLKKNSMVSLVGSYNPNEISIEIERMLSTDSDTGEWLEQLSKEFNTMANIIKA